MATGQKVTLKIKREQCSKCKNGNKAALRRHEPGCRIFLKTGAYPKIKTALCQGREIK